MYVLICVCKCVCVCVCLCLHICACVCMCMYESVCVCVVCVMCFMCVCHCIMGVRCVCAALRAGLTQTFQYCVCLAWFTAQGRHLLPTAVLRHRVATHLCLPLCGVGARCQYTGQARAGPCSAPLDPTTHHIHSCGQGPRQHKHDRLRDAWQHVLRDAGWHVAPEQIVTTTAGPHSTDLVAISPVGLSSAHYSPPGHQ